MTTVPQPPTTTPAVADEPQRPTKSVRLHLDPNPIKSTIEVEGTELTCVRNLRLFADLGRVPQLELDLVLRTVTIDGQMRVSATAPTRQELIALGWTPPETLAALLAAVAQPAPSGEAS